MACWQWQGPYDLFPGMGGPFSLVIWGNLPQQTAKGKKHPLNSTLLQQLRFIQG